MVMDSRSRNPLQRALMAAGGRFTYVTEAALVKLSAPNTTFEYNTDDRTLYKDVTDEHRIVMKFNSVVNNNPAIAFRSAIIQLGQFISDMIYEVDPPLIREINIRLEMWAIKEDFDCSAITWNTLGGLALVAWAIGVDSPYSAKALCRGESVLVRRALLLDCGSEALSKALQGGDYQNVYGLYLRIDAPGPTPHPATWSCTLDLKTDETQTTKLAYHLSVP